MFSVSAPTRFKCLSNCKFSTALPQRQKVQCEKCPSGWSEVKDKKTSSGCGSDSEGTIKVLTFQFRLFIPTDNS